MFRKLVSNLAFSPALVGQLGFYAQRLKKEEATRRVGLIFTALALVVQSFAVFSPPEAANAAANPSNFIPGGVSTLSEYLSNYDRNTNNIKDLFDTMGITRAEMAAASEQQLNSKRDGLISWGLTSLYSYGEGERTYTVRTSSGGTSTFYNRPLTNWDNAHGVTNGSSYYIYVGYSAKAGWFGLMKVCGNLVTKTQPQPPQCPSGYTGTYPDCVPPPKMCEIPGKTNLLAGDAGCKLDPKCPSGYTGTYPDCVPPPKMCEIPGKTNLLAGDAGCKLDPAATCSLLKVTKLGDNYDLRAVSGTTNGATITSYTYIIKKDGKVLDTITHTSSKLSDTAQTTQTKEGTYTVAVTVKTSLGDKTSDDCVKTFHVAPPEMCPLNPKLVKSSPECQPCPGDSMVWIKDPGCVAHIMTTKSAVDQTQGNIDAVKTTARAGDKIIYTLNLSNIGKTSSTITPTDNVNDIVEYAEVIDTNSGTYDPKSHVITWPAVTLKPGDKQSRMFTVKIVDSIPAMGIGVNERTSFDCRIDNVFGNMISINVDCPVQKKIVERTVSELPHTGPRENMMFAGIVFSVVAYFYARSRQVKKEVRLIRRDLNAGTI